MSDISSTWSLNYFHQIVEVGSKSTICLKYFHYFLEVEIIPTLSLNYFHYFLKVRKTFRLEVGLQKSVEIIQTIVVETLQKIIQTCEIK